MENIGLVRIFFLFFKVEQLKQKAGAAAEAF